MCRYVEVDVSNVYLMHKLATMALERSKRIVGRRKIIKERKPEHRGMLLILDQWNAQDELDMIARANMIIKLREAHVQARNVGALLAGQP